jgi:predicted ATPase with chaperone activity
MGLTPTSSRLRWTLGSARMQDFNVVGLSDNAVKESRERIKSAL